MGQLLIMHMLKISFALMKMKERGALKWEIPPKNNKRVF